jgi:Flp pilus assembly CpaE family ATPase
MTERLDTTSGSTGATSSPAPPDPAGARRSRPARSRVLLAIRDLGLHQEVLDFLERDPRVIVVGAVDRPEGLFALASANHPEALIVCPGIARDMRHPAASGRIQQLFVVAEDMTVPVLREAIEAGAKGVFAWPDERDELALSIRSATSTAQLGSPEHGRVIAVLGSRGGSGTTFVASHLAAAFADEGRRCVLVDLDAGFADVSVALGVEPGDRRRTIEDLIPVMDEMTMEHIQDALYHHERGIDVLLAPMEQDRGQEIPVALSIAVVELLAVHRDMVVLHLPRALCDLARKACSVSDVIVLLVASDLFSMHAARRALSTLRLIDRSERCRVVINPVGRPTADRREVEHVLGIRPCASIRFDPAVGRAQERGRLLPAGGKRAARDIRRLAALLTSAAGDVR